MAFRCWACCLKYPTRILPYLYSGNSGKGFPCRWTRKGASPKTTGRLPDGLRRTRSYKHIKKASKGDLTPNCYTTPWYISMTSMPSPKNRWSWLKVLPDSLYSRSWCCRALSHDVRYLIDATSLLPLQFTWIYELVLSLRILSSSWQMLDSRESTPYKILFFIMLHYFYFCYSLWGNSTLRNVISRIWYSLSNLFPFLIYDWLLPSSLHPSYSSLFFSPNLHSVEYIKIFYNTNFTIPAHFFTPREYICFWSCRISDFYWCLIHFHSTRWK